MYGPTAAPAYLASLNAKKNSGDLAFDDLHQAHNYAFMLDAPQNDQIAELTSHLIKGVAVGSKRRKVQASSSRATPANDKKNNKGATQRTTTTRSWRSSVEARFAPLDPERRRATHIRHPVEACRQRASEKRREEGFGWGASHRPTEALCRAMRWRAHCPTESLGRADL